MAMQLITDVELSGDGLEKARQAFRSPRTLLRRIGVLQMSSAVRRLSTSLKQEKGGVRSGRLMASLRAGAQESPKADTVWRISDSAAEVGSNLPYAAMRQYGGTIRPKPPLKNIAIPLPISFKRARTWPRHLPKDSLDFVPLHRGNLTGLLVAREKISEVAETGRGKRRAKARKGEAVFALMTEVTQTGTPYLYVDDEDRRIVAEELFPQWLRGE